MTRWVLLLKIITFITNVSQSFETEAEGFAFTFQPKDDSDSEVEITEQVNDNQSDEETEISFYLPSSDSEPTPPPSPCAPPSHPTTPLCSPPPQPKLKPAEVLTGSKRNHNLSSPEPKKVKKKATSAIRHALEYPLKLNMDYSNISQKEHKKTGMLTFKGG